MENQNGVDLANSASVAQKIWFRNGGASSSQETLSMPLVPECAAEQVALEDKRAQQKARLEASVRKDLPRPVLVCFVLLITAVLVLSIQLAAISYKSAVAKKSIKVAVAPSHDENLHCERCEHHYRPFCCRKKHGVWSKDDLYFINNTASKNRLHSIAGALNYVASFLVKFKAKAGGICFGVSPTGEVLSVHNVNVSKSEASTHCVAMESFLAKVQSLEKAAYLLALTRSCAVTQFWFNDKESCLSTGNSTKSTEPLWFGDNIYVYSDQLHSMNCDQRCVQPRPFVCEHQI